MHPLKDVFLFYIRFTGRINFFTKIENKWMNLNLGL